MITSSAEELRELRSMLRSFFDARSPESTVRATMDSESGYDHELWTSMAVELGLHGLSVPEEFGGGGAGWAEQGIVFEEMGRALVCAPYLSTIGLAVPLLLAAEDRIAAGRWLPEICKGTVVATAALTGSPRRSAADVPVSAQRDGDGWMLSGHEQHVLDGGTAQLTLVLGRTDAGVSLFAVDGRPAGMRVTTPKTSDRTRRIAAVEFSAVRAALVGPDGAGLDIAGRALPSTVAALACEQVGGCARVLEMAVDYACTRIQFGRPIGSFQAVKHRCADMLVALETARSAAWMAVRALDSGSDSDHDTALVAGIARVACSEAYTRCASDCLQVHGGIGYTWEHAAHLHVKRSRSSAALLGTPAEHRRMISELAPELAVANG